MAKNEKPFGVCWNCSGKGHVSSQFPSPSTSSNSKLDKRSHPRRMTSMTSTPLADLTILLMPLWLLKKMVSGLHSSSQISMTIMSVPQRVSGVSLMSHGTTFLDICPIPVLLTHWLVFQTCRQSVTPLPVLHLLCHLYVLKPVNG